MAGIIRLGMATNNWTSALVVRTYEGKNAAKDFEEEGNLFSLRGYSIEGQTSDGGHIHAGRLLLTGGLSIFAGRAGTRSKNKMTVTFVKMKGDPASVVVTAVKHGPIATGTGQNALTIAGSTVNAYKAELPIEILSGIPRGQADHVVAYLANAGVESHVTTAGPTEHPNVTSSDALLSEELERLAALHRAGVLDDDEFASAKKRLLAN